MAFVAVSSASIPRPLPSTILGASVYIFRTQSRACGQQPKKSWSTAQTRVSWCGRRVRREDDFQTISNIAGLVDSGIWPVVRPTRLRTTNTAGHATSAEEDRGVGKRIERAEVTGQLGVSASAASRPWSQQRSDSGNSAGRREGRTGQAVQLPQFLRLCDVG